MQEKKLLRLLEKDPDAALRQLMDTYGALLYSVAYGVLRDQRDAEECVSDALVKLWQTRERLRQPQRLKSYLCAIARNAALDRLRAKAPYQELSLQQELLEDVTVSDRLEDVMLEALVTDAIEGLGEPGKTIFLRRFYREERVKDIAADLGMTPRAVESQLYRGKKRLKTMLQQGGLDYEAQ